MLSFQNPQRLIAYLSGMRFAGMVTKVKRSRSMYPEDTWTNGQQIGCSNTEQSHEARKTVNKIILTQSALMFSSSHCVPCMCMCVCVVCILAVAQYWVEILQAFFLNPESLLKQL